MASDRLPFLDLTDPGFSTRGAEVLAARARHWCARTPYGLAVLRHRQAGQLLRDRRLRQGSYAWPGTQRLEGSFTDFWTASVIAQEGAPHKRLRALAVPVLSAGFIDGLRPEFDAIAAELAMDIVAQETVEFMEAFATPYCRARDLRAARRGSRRLAGAGARRIDPGSGHGGRGEKPRGGCERSMRAIDGPGGAADQPRAGWPGQAGLCRAACGAGGRIGGGGSMRPNF